MPGTASQPDQTRAGEMSEPSTDISPHVKFDPDAAGAGQDRERRADVSVMTGKSTLRTPIGQSAHMNSAHISAKFRSHRTSSGLDRPDYMEHQICLKAFDIVHSPYWDPFFFLVICLNAIEMGFFFHFDEGQYDDIFVGLDTVFMMLYLFETVTTFLAFGHRVFFNFWYCLGAFCTLAAVGDMIFRATSLGQEFKMTSKFLKSVRLLMLGKLLRAHPETRLIVQSMVRSLAALRGVLIVLAVVLYGCTLGVYAVVGQKKQYEEEGVQFNEQDHDVYFGNIAKTMLTMFSMLILSEWENFVRPIYEVQPYFVVFFVLFTMTLTFGLMNVLIGIIVDTVNRIHQEHEDRQRERDVNKQKIALEMIVDMIFGEEVEIDEDKFLKHVEDEPEIFRILHGFHVPDHFTFEDLFTMLDENQDGLIAKEELADGLFSFLAGNENARFCLLQLNISKTHRDICDIRQMLVDMTGRETNRMRSQSIRSQSRRPRGNSSRSDLSAISDDCRNSDVSVGNRISAGSDFMGSAPLGSSSLPINQVSNSSFAAAVDGVGTTANSVSNQKTPGGLWGQCYSSLRTTVEKHCKLELDSSWERLQTWYETVNNGPAPRAGLLPGSSNLNDQEHLMIWKKLHHAVCNESEIELRHAVDHATTVGIDSSRLALELTYKEALKLYRGRTLPVTEVQEAITKGDWSSSFGMVIDCALANGADKHILSNVITRVSQDSGISSSYTNAASARRETSRERAETMNSASPASTASYSGWDIDTAVIASPIPSSTADGDYTVQGRAAGVRKFPAIRTKVGSDVKAENMQEHVLTILHAEAVRHSTEQRSKAWQALKDFGDIDDPASVPLSQSEELFFIYNQMCNAVQRKSFADLQRALTQAIVAGLDMRTLDIEVAYRDALSRCYKDPAHSIRLAVDAFRRKEWYLTLDLLIQVSLARGADKQSLLRVLTKIFVETGRH